jgi:hypothetical protein
MSKVKLSVYVTADLHRQAKYLSFEKGTTIQHVVEDALQRSLDPKRTQAPVLKPKELRILISQFREIVQSGNELFIANCVASIRGTYALLKAERRTPESTIVAIGPAKSEEPKKPEHRRRRKTENALATA